MNGIPAWTVVIAGVSRNQTLIAVIHEPNVAEIYVGERRKGAELHGKPLSVAADVPLNAGTVSAGYSICVEAEPVLDVVAALMERAALCYRNASYALSLAYVAAAGS